MQMLGTGMLREENLTEILYVKSDKPHITYTYYKMLSDLRNTPPEILAAELKGKISTEDCHNAEELLYLTPTHLKSVVHYREFVEPSQHFDLIRRSPIFLLDQTKLVNAFHAKFRVEQMQKNKR